MRLIHFWRFALLICCLGGFVQAANSSLPLVQKQRFELSEFKTQNGQSIAQVQIGWEAYGTLNPSKSNVILITHYFSGTSHAAGKYHADDALPGYWDSIIGPGKAIDTNRFYVISIDTLVNANVHDPKVITTGPASINPATGKPYGLSFPVVSIRDFVEVQRALLESLGIQQLYAVIGASMGSFQAIEWATAYPERVERLIPVIGSAYMDAWTAVRLERWAQPIKQDPHWQQGQYYGQKNQPHVGLQTALAYITQDASNPIAFNQRFSDPAMDQAASLDIQQDLQAWTQLLEQAKLRAQQQDANHILYLVRASQLWRAGMADDWRKSLAKVRAKTLFLPATADLLLTPQMSEQSHQVLQQQGQSTQLHSIAGDRGHLEGILGIQSVAELLTSFLQQP